MATAIGSVVCSPCCVRGMTTRTPGYNSRTRACSSLQHHPSDAQVNVVGVGSEDTFPQGRQTVVSWLEQGSASQPMRSQQGGCRNTLRDSEPSGSQSSTKRMKWTLGSIVYARERTLTSSLQLTYYSVYSLLPSGNEIHRFQNICENGSPVLTLFFANSQYL